MVTHQDDGQEPEQIPLQSLYHELAEHLGQEEPFDVEAGLADLRRRSVEMSEDVMVALSRLRDAVFLALDEAGTTGTVTNGTAHNLVMLSADVVATASKKFDQGSRR